MTFIKLFAKILFSPFYFVLFSFACFVYLVNITFDTDCDIIDEYGEFSFKAVLKEFGIYNYWKFKE